MIREIRRFSSAMALMSATAEYVVATADEAIAERKQFTIALSGGTTPGPLYELLATDYKDAIDWSATHVFWADERCVPPHHPASNYWFANTRLLRHLPLIPDHLHRVHGEVGCGAAASRYEAELARFFHAADPVTRSISGRAAFDLVLLGIGTDGHTASLFPGSPALQAGTWAAAVDAPNGVSPKHRVTLTLAALATARHIVFLAAGAEKRDSIARALARSPDDPAAPPAARVRARSSVSWFVEDLSS